MTFPRSLLDGYQTFRKDRYRPLADQYAAFEHGQDPDVLVIACADSRVDPATVFNAAPGELFVLRNVAALVPPYQADGKLHGVSAGMEFAVKVLGVSHIVVMGHGLCGGVNACLHAHEADIPDEFLAQWIELAAPAREAVNAALPDGSEEERQRLGEYKTIEVSLSNLMLFPFVRERVEAGEIELHGLWYSVHKGHLRLLNHETGEFDLVRDEEG